MFRNFTGFQTNVDPTKISIGANAQGQNTTVNEGDRISIRNFGTDIFPINASYSSNFEPIVSKTTFHKRNGENIMIRSKQTSPTTAVLEYYANDVSDFTNLNDGYTSADFGFGEININTDQSSFLYFGNAVQNFSRWNGAHTILTLPLVGGETMITVADTSTFSGTAGILRIGTQNITYIAKTATTFTLAAPVVGAYANGVGVIQAVDVFVTTGTDFYPKGNIYLTANNRLFISGVIGEEQLVYFSKYGDATLFVNTGLISASTASSPGFFNLVEGGGGVVSMVLNEEEIDIFKKSIIYKVTPTDSLYTLKPLKTFDNKSQTIGALTKRGVFTTGNGVLFITADKQIMLLTHIEEITYPQILPISYAIKNTIENLDFSKTTGVVYQNRIFIACKSTIGAIANDTVLVYNLNTKQWDSPIVGWSVGDFTIFNNGSGDRLYYGDGLNPNTFVVTNKTLDYIYGLSCNWRSKYFDFDNPQILKEVTDVYIEGYIGSDTDLYVTLFYDENGFTQKLTTKISGSDTDLQFFSSAFNLFGFLPFGTERFGSNADFSGKKPFRVHLEKFLRTKPFHNLQIEFASDGENRYWEVNTFGFYWDLAEKPTDRKIKRPWQT